MEEKTKGKFLFHDTVISWACIIWAVCSIGLMIYFSGLNQVTFTLMTFGQLFVILGIILICRKQTAGIATLITGIGCIILPAISEWGYLFNINFAQNNIFQIFLPTAISVLGLAMLIGPGVLDDIAERKCKVTVQAELFDYKTSKVNNDETAYAPVYKYKFLDTEYEKCTEKYRTNKVDEIGKKINIKINEKNPEEVFIETSKSSKMIIYIFGISFLMAGLGMLITVLGEI